MFELFGPQASLFHTLFVKIPLWIKIAGETDKETRHRLLHQVLESYHSFLDVPAIAYFEDLMEMYPNKRVLLSIRSNPDVWYESARQTSLLFARETSWDPRLDSQNLGLWAFFTLNPLGVYLSKFHAMTRGNRLFPHGVEETQAKQSYKDWIEYVTRVVPKDRLLVYQVEQGWEPLVQFLGTNSPEGAFPRVNDRAELQTYINGVELMGWITLGFVLSFTLSTIKRVVQKCLIF